MESPPSKFRITHPPALSLTRPIASSHIMSKHKKKSSAAKRYLTKKQVMVVVMKKSHSPRINKLRRPELCWIRKRRTQQGVTRCWLMVGGGVAWLYRHRHGCLGCVFETCFEGGEREGRRRPGVEASIKVFFLFLYPGKNNLLDSHFEACTWRGLSVLPCPGEPYSFNFLSTPGPIYLPYLLGR